MSHAPYRRFTAFPQAKPGEEPGLGPLRAPADRLRHVLGITSVDYVRGRHFLAIVDTPLA